MSEFSFGAWQRLVVDAMSRGVISSGSALTAFVLEMHADHGSGRNAWPSVETLAGLQHCGVSTVRRHLRELRDAGLIAMTHRGGGPKRRPATYCMTMPNSDHQRSENDEVTNDEWAASPWSESPNSDHQESELANSDQNSDHNSAHQSTPTSLTSLTSITYDTYAADPGSAQRGATDEVVYQELVAGLSEAIANEYVSLPYSHAESYEQQAVAVLADVLPALAVDGVDIPLLYLRAILQRDDEFQFGLAVRERWLCLVGEEAW